MAVSSATTPPPKDGDSTFLTTIETLKNAVSDGYLINDRLEVISRYSLTWIWESTKAFFLWMVGVETFASFRSNHVIEAITEYCTENIDILSFNPNLTETIQNEILTPLQTKTGEKYQESFQEFSKKLAPIEIHWPENHPFILDTTTITDPSKIFSLSESEKEQIESLLRNYAIYRRFGHDVELSFQKVKNIEEVTRTFSLVNRSTKQLIGKIDNLSHSILFADPEEEGSLPHIFLCSKKGYLDIDPSTETSSSDSSSSDSSLISRVPFLKNPQLKRKINKTFDITTGKWWIRKKTDKDEVSNLQEVEKLSPEKRKFLEKGFVVPTFRQKIGNWYHSEEKRYVDYRKHPTENKEIEFSTKSYLLEEMQSGDLLILIDSDSEMSTAQKVCLIHDLIRGLMSLHQITVQRKMIDKMVTLPFSHNDLKLENILVKKEDDPVHTFVPIIFDIEKSTTSNFAFTDSVATAQLQVVISMYDDLDEEMESSNADDKKKKAKEQSELLTAYFKEYGQADDVWVLGQILLSILTKKNRSFRFYEWMEECSKSSDFDDKEMVEKETASMKETHRFSDEFLQECQEKCEEKIQLALKDFQWNDQLSTLFNNVIHPMLQIDHRNRISMKDALKAFEEIYTDDPASFFKDRAKEEAS